MITANIKRYYGVVLGFAATFAVLWSAGNALALTLPAEGRLSTIAGGPVADGVYAVKFRLYPSKDGQVAVWEETWVGLQLSLGMFYAELGTQDLKSPITPELLVQNQDLWLSIQVSLDPELPRVRIGRVPYAVHALIADKLAGPLDGKQIADGSVTAKTVDFPYALSNQRRARDRFAVHRLRRPKRSGKRCARREKHRFQQIYGAKDADRFPNGCAS